MKAESHAALRGKRLAALLMCLMMAAALLPLWAASAQETGKAVRVGWYESAFHRTDPFGRRSGYGYEYQQRVATFTGWTYEYVEGSWSELFEMLVAGEIDLLSDVSFTEARAEKILYSALGMGSEDYHAFIAPDNTDIRPDDFSTFNGKRVGVNKNSIQEQLFIEWAKSHGVQPEIVELTGKSPELLAMLAKGEIDVLVTLDAYGKSADVVPVCKVGASDFYFGVSKSRPDLKSELDAAMNRILEDNRYFNEQLAEKYENSQGISSFLTPDELDWYVSHGAIRVGYRDNYLPFCGLDAASHTLSGALQDMLSFAETCEKNAKLVFETRAFDTTESALQALKNGEIDCLFPICMSAYDGELLGVIVTDTFISTEMYAAVRAADHQGISPDQAMNVAVVQGNPSNEIFLMDYLPNWRVTYFSDSISGFQAVAAGAADCVLMSNYRLNRMSALCEQYRLTPLSTGKAMDLSFAVRREDDCLYSILNKISRLIPDATINASLTYYAKEDTKTTFTDFIKDNWLIVLMVMTAVFLTILLLLLASLRSAKRANEGRQLISATENDELTGLYNRSFFYEYASRMYREHPDRPMDAVVLNIEQFHSVNALNGWEFGDQVLRALGGEIRAYLSGKEGIAGRFGADRFDLYCEHTENWQALYEALQSKLDELSRNVNIRLRMGVMPWQAETEPMQLFEQANTACGMARGHYKKHLIVFDDQARGREIFEQRLINDLRRAMEEQQFEVYYQPKYDIQCEPPQIRSAEALIRWRHPELGLLGPDEFIPLFERNGQISRVDKYVWEKAARQIARWRDLYGVTMPISVNLSRVDVFDPALESILDAMLSENGLSRSVLTLEVTESAYTENADQVIRVIERLRSKGYRIEMDDFGSGYSSLNMLSSMPIDVLKMDRAFIRNIEHSEKDVRLVELILEIARSLKVPVVAEGVETEAQVQMLRKLGCALVQGYYFSRPLSAPAFEKLTLEGR